MGYNSPFKMKIAIIGYGKMGKTIESVAIKRGHSIVARLDSKSDAKSWGSISLADIAIEFSRPEAAIENYKKCLDLKVPLVTGTTGWYEQMELIRQKVQNSDGSFFWASNFSIGVNLFWQINKKLAALMNSHKEYKASMIEIHHTQKLDEPSGTAITTAEQIINSLDGYTNWTLEKDGIKDSEISIEAIREGDVKGTHIVRYENDIDLIELKHAAKSREGFAIGSVLAAEFLICKKGFFTMTDMLDS